MNVARFSHTATLTTNGQVGRLILDRVARQQSPSPLHRHGQNKIIATIKGTIHHRTVTSVLTGCFTSGGHPRFTSIPAGGSISSVFDCV